jgi:hypothetical protein
MAARSPRRVVSHNIQQMTDILLDETSLDYVTEMIQEVSIGATLLDEALPAVRYTGAPCQDAVARNCGGKYVHGDFLRVCCYLIIAVDCHCRS